MRVSCKLLEVEVTSKQPIHASEALRMAEEAVNKEVAAILLDRYSVRMKTYPCSVAAGQSRRLLQVSIHGKKATEHVANIDVMVTNSYHEDDGGNANDA